MLRFANEFSELALLRQREYGRRVTALELLASASEGIARTIILLAWTAY
jgi:hypothetical protein